MTDTPAAARLRKVAHRVVDVVVDAWPTRGRAILEFWYLPDPDGPGRPNEPTAAQWVDVTRRKLRHEVAVDAAPDGAPPRPPGPPRRADLAEDIAWAMKTRGMA